jgi:2-C-methyl-D-erythritol 4-phosphate cytidylyltransferase/2-C-methyl-D-erythritol 2,4-cyclodiphosphate synthase
VLARTLSVFLSHPQIDRVLAVIHPGDRPLYEAALFELAPGDRARLDPPVFGGATRQDSARAGFEALARANLPDIVLVHDGARPFADPALLDRAIEAASSHGAAVPGLALVDTVKRVDSHGIAVETPERTSLRAVQTPQAFRFESLLEAHRRAAAARLDGFTDDGALAEWAGLSVAVFEGDPANIKLTTEQDFEAAAWRLRQEAGMLVTKVATGFDVHVLFEGDHVWLGGVRIPAERGVLAHSDGDVVLHALTDAVLGCLADGDIGVHFPPSDARWRGASSDQFLAFAAERVRAQGGIIDHLDATILCEAPRVGPHREAMVARIAEIAGVSQRAVSIKATTTERLGFTGRGEGIAAQASATIRLPEAGV